VVVLGYFSGVGYGPVGVATGFSVSMLVLVVPVIFWSTHGTSISAADTFRGILPTVISIAVASAAASTCSIAANLLPFPLLRLFVVNGVLFGVYAGMLWFVMGQKEVYLNVLNGLGFKSPFRRGTS
jgi:hypothetical protein